MQVTSSSVQMPQIHGAVADELSDNPQSECCQLQCFGRTVSSLPKREVIFIVNCVAFVSVGMSVGAAAGGVAVAAGVAVGTAASAAAGITAGFAASFAAGKFTECVYDKCRLAAPTDSPVQLSRIISHAPEASDEPTETFSPINDTILSPPPYTPESPPPPYTPRTDDFSHQ